jgi:protein-tyrosine phosphatase
MWLLDRFGLRVEIGQDVVLSPHRERLVPPHAHHDLELFLEHVGFDGIDEVPDPYYGGTRDFAHVLDLARRGSALLIERLNASRAQARA